MSSDQSSSLSSIHSDTARQGCKIWGGELSASRKTCKFESEEDNMIHLLSLWTWGGKLEDVMGICQVNVHDIEITPPVTFILMSGSGPVYISGQDILVDDQLDNLAPEEDPSFEKRDPEMQEPHLYEILNNYPLANIALCMLSKL